MADECYVLHPQLLAFPKVVEGKRGFVLERNAAEPPYIVESPLLAWALFVLPVSFTHADALQTWEAEPEARSRAEEIWDFLVAETLILPRQSDDPALLRHRTLRDLGWHESAIYHEGTRDYPFLLMGTKEAFASDNARMKGYAEEEPPYSCYQSHPSTQRIALEKFNVSTVPETPATGDVHHQLSLVLDIAFGERSRLPASYEAENDFLQLESLRKAVPSGGGRHPTEAFLLVMTGGLNLPLGVYHYHTATHSLDRLVQDLRPDLMGALTEAVPEATAFIVLTSLCERAMWRYREARSWRAILLDAGHVEQMCHDLCATVGWQSLSLHRFDSTAISQSLGTDPFRQPVLSIISIATGKDGTEPTVCAI